MKQLVYHNETVQIIITKFSWNILSCSHLKKDIHILQKYKSEIMGDSLISYIIKAEQSIRLTIKFAQNILFK